VPRLCATVSLFPLTWYVPQLFGVRKLGFLIRALLFDVHAAKRAPSLKIRRSHNTSPIPLLLAPLFLYLSHLIIAAVGSAEENRNPNSGEWGNTHVLQRLLKQPLFDAALYV